MKKKWIIIIAVAAVIAIGGSFLLIGKEEKKNSTVSGSPEIEKTLNAIKEKQSELVSFVVIGSLIERGTLPNAASCIT